jgi:hypothetical protein
MNRGPAPSLSWLRAVLVLVVLIDLVSLCFLLGDAREIGLANGALNSFNDLVSTTSVRGVIALVGAAGAVAFGRRPGRLWHGMLALAALILLNTAHAQLFGSPWRHLFFSGLCLSGWLLGLAVSRRRGAPTDESYAYAGALALLAAAYLNAGISKIVYGGFDWLSGLPIQATIVAQDGLVPDSVLSPYRAWVAVTPAAASLFSLATMAFELGAPLMLVGGWIRASVALGLFAMHANIYGLTAILYWQSMVLLLAFGACAAGTSSPSGAAAPDASGGRGFAVAAGLLAACALLAIFHQARRYARSEADQTWIPLAVAPVASTDTPVPPTATATAARLRNIGPFAVGQTVAAGWTVERLDLSESGIVAMLSGARGRVAFEMTCASSPYRSPFDVDGLHIFYSSDVPSEDLQLPGLAVQKHVRNAAAGGDPCDLLGRWRAVSAATPPPPQESAD